jgi:hypothetical protein
MAMNIEEFSKSYKVTVVNRLIENHPWRLESAELASAPPSPRVHVALRTLRDLNYQHE